MSGLPYSDMRNMLQQMPLQQYGVSNLLSSGSSVVGGLGLGNAMPVIGPLIGAGMNLVSQYMQNQTQREMYNAYMSPQARMAQMRAAGINTNAAAQGISGSSAPQMNAAAPTSAFNSLGEQLGQSVNTSLNASLLRSQIGKVDAETNLTKSLDIEQTIKNIYADKLQSATLNKMISDGEISRSTANMLKVDEYYKGPSAEANYQQLILNLSKTGAEINELYSRMIQEYAAAYQSMANAALSEAQIHKVFSDIGLNNAQIEKISHEVGEIDARTASTYQDIDESKARTTLLGIQSKFQQDYYDIWQATGFNWNSDIEKSIVGAASNLQIDEAERMLRGVGMYVRKTGDARSEAKDYTYDKLTQIFGDLTRFAGMAGIGRGVASSPVFRPRRTRTSDGRISLFGNNGN